MVPDHIVDVDAYLQKHPRTLVVACPACHATMLMPVDDAEGMLRSAREAWDAGAAPGATLFCRECLRAHTS
jgi:hypothetical protein